MRSKPHNGSAAETKTAIRAFPRRGRELGAARRAPRCRALRIEDLVGKRGVMIQARQRASPLFLEERAHLLDTTGRDANLDFRFA